ncbi:MAG TPA: glycosyltransferase family 39 protein [Ignavibacteria bacterium]|jgi:4-amino-4-deoxy-L-arabinose transferase-like glycosyltransferase
MVNSKPVSDSNWYFEKGLDIASGKGYSIEGTPTAYYPVGYPFFLGLIFMIFGNNLFAAKITNVLLAVGILYFSYFTSKKMFDSERVGRITLFILAIYPNHIAYSSIIATETLFLFLILFGAYLFFIAKNNYWLFMASGFIWGLMCLVKPQGFFIPILFLLALWLQEKKTFREALKPMMIIYVIVIIALLPWAIRNYYVFNEPFIISTNDGINLVMGNNPYATGEYNLDDKVIEFIWDSENEYATPDSLVNSLRYTAFWTRYGYKDENIANKKLRKKAVDYIFSNPSKIMKLLPRKLWLNYKKGNEGIGWAISELTIEGTLKKNIISALGKIANYFYYLSMAFFFFYFVRFAYKSYIEKEKLQVPLIGPLIILYFTLLALIYFGTYRFHFPTLPFIAMFSAAFAESLLNTGRKKKKFKERLPGNETKKFY